MNLSPLHAAFNEQAAQPDENPRLKTAAHQFEASLMQELLKPLQHDPLFTPDSSSAGSDGGGEDQGSAGALMSFGSEALAQAISEHGGFGIATKILDHFRTEANASGHVSSRKV
jgi:Rod binding domain-containing protein